MPATPAAKKSTALPEDMIAVGLAGRLTEQVFNMHHDKGVQLKDPVAELAKWIRIGQDAYKKAINSDVDAVLDTFPGAKVEDDNDLDDNIPF